MMTEYRIAGNKKWAIIDGKRVEKAKLSDFAIEMFEKIGWHKELEELKNAFNGK